MAARWWRAEDQLLRAVYPTDGGARVVALTGRSLDSIHWRAKKLGVQRLPLSPEERRRRKLIYRTVNREALAASHRARVKKRRRAGLCRECTKPVLAGYTRCAGHVEARRASTAAKRTARAARGLCGTCGKRPPKPGGTVCPRCQERVERWRRLHETPKGKS